MNLFTLSKLTLLAIVPLDTCLPLCALRDFRDFMGPVSMGMGVSVSALSGDF